MTKEPDYDADMKLPEGKTCADCQNGPTCDALFGAVKRAFTKCDYWPSQYTPRRESPRGFGARGNL